MKRTGVQVESGRSQGARSSSSGLLQRQCACGTHTMGGEQCAECQKKKMGVGGRPLQTKLTISEPGDTYEQEADRVAEQVMRMSPSDVSKRQKSEMTQPLVQRRASGNATGLAEAPPIVHDVLNSPGQPLDPATRAFFEPRFGHDFSNVKVHSGVAAGQSAVDVNAHAYTVGHNIVFGTGQFSTETSMGRRLLAHELTHVVQQSGVDASYSVQRATTRGAGGCATSMTEEDENDNGPMGAGERAHTQIQTFLLPMLNEVPIPRATKRNIDTQGCQGVDTSLGYADLMRRSGILYEIGEIKPIGSAPTRGVLESEHYIRRADQSVDRLYGTGICGTAGDDDRDFQRGYLRGPLRPSFSKLTGVLPNTTVIGDFIGDRTRTLKAKTVAPGAIGYWCTGGGSDTYTCGVSAEETARYVDRVVGGPAQEVLDGFIRDHIQRPLEATLRRQSLGDLIRLAERHFGTQIRQMLRPYLGPVADQVLSRATAEQIAQLLDQAVGAEVRSIVTTLVRLVSDTLISELRNQLRSVLTELVRNALVALCVGVPAVALSDLLDRIRQLLREQTQRLIPVVVTVVAARVATAILAELSAMLTRMVEAIGQALGFIGEVLLAIGEILVRALAAIAIALLVVGAIILGILALIAVFDPVPGDEALLGAGSAALLMLIPALGRFVATGSTEERPEGD